MEVTPRPITIFTASSEKIYDGTSLSNSNWELVQGSLAPNQSISVQMVSEIIKMGQIQNEAHVTIYDIYNQNVDSNYDITYLFGTLSILPRHMVIRTMNHEKYYDGSPLLGQDYEIISGTVAPNETIEITNHSSITLPGTIINEVIISIYDNKNESTESNYEFSYEYGNLTVYKREITIESEDKSKIYDGQPLIATGYRIISGNLLDTHQMHVVTSKQITDVQFIENDIHVTITTLDGEDVTKYYEIIKLLGYLEIVPRPLSITTLSAEKEYDGTYLTYTEFVVTSGSLVEKT